MRFRAGVLTIAAASVVLGVAFAQPAPRPKPGFSGPDSTIADPIAALERKSEDSLHRAQNRVKALPVVLDTRIGEHGGKTRFVVEVSDPLQLRVFTLADPDRVVVDMPEVLWRIQQAERPTGKGAVKSYRYGLFRPGNSRFVIDLNGPVRVADPMVLPPQGGHGYRIVFDLFPTTRAKFLAAAGWPADLRARENAAERLAARESRATGNAQSAPGANKRIIVVDAGHGGIDSGTSGINGLQEKDLVLDMALRLRKALQRRGNYTVYLTRDDDTYIPLGQRVKIARTDHADLFISLHADSNPSPSVSGASVYTLSERGSDKEAAALAQKENQSDIIAGVDLSQEDAPVASILIDLAQRDTMNRSTRFAQTVVQKLSGVTDILPRRPHRSAAFVVLKAPDVPAVLIELGYLSNAGDAGQMETTAWRSSVADAIASAVDNNFGLPKGGRTAAQTVSD
jgi:N-acetylmuramoyl-L-alanine amidase